MTRLRMTLAILAIGALTGPATACAESQAHFPGTAAAVQADTSFARLIEDLSEPSGFFDTDNLISNETSYLHVLGALQRLNIRGGAYIGVGPDQNFSYIASIEPDVAFIIDIRRDNLLHLLLYRALFTLSENRIEYLSLFFGRPPPTDPANWGNRSAEELLAYIDTTPVDADWVVRTQAEILAAVDRFGPALTETDLSTIRRFHDEFIRKGLDLRFQSFGRAPRSYYPTYRQLLLETDLTGRRRSYLITESSFEHIRSMQSEGRIIPVVGDLAGPTALRAIGDEIRERGLEVSAFYTSNVEFYLAQDGIFDRFVENLRSLPTSERSVIIRSYFGGGFRPRHSLAVPGHRSTQLVHNLQGMLGRLRVGSYSSYYDLVEDAVTPR